MTKWPDGAKRQRYSVRRHRLSNKWYVCDLTKKDRPVKPYTKMSTDDARNKAYELEAYWQRH